MILSNPSVEYKHNLVHFVDLFVFEIKHYLRIMTLLEASMQFILDCCEGGGGGDIKGKRAYDWGLCQDGAKTIKKLLSAVPAIMTRLPEIYCKQFHSAFFLLFYIQLSLCHRKCFLFL